VTTTRIKIVAFNQSPVAVFGSMVVDGLKRFSDEINNNQDTIQLEDTQYIVIGTNTVMGQASVGIIRKSNVVFINREPETSKEKDDRPFKARAVDRQQVSILAGDWLVSGVISLPPKQPLELTIAPPSIGFRFLPVTSANAVYIPNPNMVVNGGVVLLVNRAFITSLLVPSYSEASWHDGLFIASAR
jgi:hypothetical protein